MSITLEIYELRNMLEKAAERGAINALQTVGYKQSDEISKREAVRLYGHAIIERWITTGLIKGERRGTSVNSKIYFSRQKLESLKESESNIIIK